MAEENYSENNLCLAKLLKERWHILGGVVLSNNDEKDTLSNNDMLSNSEELSENVKLGHMC